MSKYFLYALGEVFLVVIGIFIALQANNWNEERKLRKEEFHLLTDLLDEFITDSSSLENVIHLTQKKVEDGNAIRNHIQGDTSLNKVKLISNVFFNGKPLVFESFTPSYDEILASGKSGILTSKELKTKIRVYKEGLASYENFYYKEYRANKLNYNNYIHEYFDASLMSFLWKSLENREVKINESELSNFRMDINGFVSDAESIIHIENVIGADAELNWAYGFRTKFNLLNVLDNLREEIKMRKS